MTSRVKVYHGTSRDRWTMISCEGFKILPIYVTPYRNQAEHYAMARTAHDGLDRYALVSFWLPQEWLLPDDYSESESGQFKVERKIPLTTIYSQYCSLEEGDMPTDETELLRLKCFGLCMAWGDERRRA